jgi:hypothetical protein
MPRPDDAAGANTETLPPDLGFARTVMGALEQKAPSSAAAAGAPIGAQRYSIAQLIGEGGMGRVLEARDLQFARTVALKQLRKDAASAAARERFVLEALVTGNLEHPGVPTVYERGELSDGSAFYAMRLVRGRTFAQAIADAPDLAGRLKLVPVVIKVAQTLGFAHERGIVHRDIKPDNVIVGRYGEAVVLDWGIAKVRGISQTGEPSTGAIGASSTGSSSQTRQGAVMGTPAYMAPEQAAGEVDRIDARTDVFALGGLLYHLLTGHAPFAGPDVKTVLERAAKAQAEPLAVTAKAAPQGIRAICEKAMARSQDDRYQTAGDFADALESFTADAVAGRESRAVKWFANLVALGGALVLAVATVVMTQQVSSLRDQGFFGIFPVLFAVDGCALAAVEWWTRGRYRLGPLTLAFAIATFFIGVATTAWGMTLVFEKLRQDEVAQDAALYRGMLAEGMRETLGSVANACLYSAVQLTLWAIARRRAPR